MRLQSLLLCGVVAVAAAHDRAYAQAPQGATIEEVVVTARKKAESLQHVPVALSAVQGPELQRQGIRQALDLQRIVPSLRIEAPSSAGSTGMVVSIRGQRASDVLLTISQPVGLYEDDVNIPHPLGTNISLFDLERIEVLKGPQGTLYGRNTTGGALNIITRGADYDGVHGFAYGEVGNHENWKIAGAVNVPIIQDVLAARLAYQHWNREGFGRSAITGQRLGGPKDDDVIRGSLRFEPTPDLRVIGKLEYVHADRTDNLFQTRRLVNPARTDQEWVLEGSLGGVAPSQLVQRRDLFTNYGRELWSERLKGWHGVLDASWDITDAVTLRSITGYHKFTDFHIFELGGMPIQTYGPGVASNGIQPARGVETRPLRPDQQSRQWTQEINLSGNVWDDRFSWLVGGFVSDDRGDSNQTALVYPPALNAAGALGPYDSNFWSPSVKSSTWAFYTQNDVKFSDVFSVTFGARYTEERLKQTVGAYLHQLTPGLARPFLCNAGPLQGSNQAQEEACLIAQRAKFNGTSYLLSFNFQFTPDTLLYIKTARGFRGGALQVRAPSQPAAAPETATDYELGLKSEFLDRRLRANVAVFQTNYDNKQEQAIVQAANGSIFTPIINAASARIQGVEAEITATPMQGLTLHANVGVLNGRYLDYPGALTTWGAVVNGGGARFAAPRRTYDIGANYTTPIGPGELGLSASYSWRSRIPTTILNDDPGLPDALQKEWRQSVGLVNASVEYTLPDMGLTLTAFATNLANKHYQVQQQTFTAYGYTGVTQEPRMWGVSVRKTFGKE